MPDKETPKIDASKSDKHKTNNSNLSQHDQTPTPVSVRDMTLRQTRNIAERKAIEKLIPN